MPARHAGDDLGDPVAGYRLPLHPAGQRRAQRDRGIEVAAGDGAERVDAGEYRQPECERDTEEADSDRCPVGHELRGEHRAAAAAEDQPERSDELGCQSVQHCRLAHARLLRWT